MKRKALLTLVLAAVFCAGLAAALRPSIATGHTGGATIDCHAVLFSYASFADAENNVSESITIDAVSVYAASFMFTGTSGGHVVSISPGDGLHVVVAGASWNTSGHAGSFSTEAQVDCGGQTTTTETTTSSPPPTSPPEIPCGGKGLPNPPGGKDGNPGNDDCVPDASPAPPLTIDTTTTVSPLPDTTTVTVPVVSPPPVVAPPVVSPPGDSGTTPKPHKAKKPKSKRHIDVDSASTPPPVCPVAMPSSSRCSVQGSG